MTCIYNAKQACPVGYSDLIKDHRDDPYVVASVCQVCKLDRIAYLLYKLVGKIH